MYILKKIKTKKLMKHYGVSDFDLPRNKCLAPCDMWYQSNTENCYAWNVLLVDFKSSEYATNSMIKL